MASKRKFSFVSVISSDSDSDTEAEKRFCEEFQAKVDKALRKEEFNKKLTGSDTTDANVGNVDMLESVEANSACNVDVKPEIHRSEDGEVMVVPRVGRVVEIESASGKDESTSPAMSSSDPDEVIVISSGEESDTIDFANESFSANQEGSKIVQNLMFKEEMGKT